MKHWLLLSVVLLALGAGTIAGCVSQRQRGSSGADDAMRDGRVLEVQHGTASWYGGKWQGRKTASGERFNQWAMSAAHRTLPFGTVVRVTNKRNQRQVRVRINDRGPFGKRRRILDVSRKAAEALGMIRDGVVPIKLEVLKLPDERPAVSLR